MPFDADTPVEVNSRLRPFLVADLFCGAGGSSTGAQRALAASGRRMELVAVNHWDRAIETHSLNHPTARHYCMDLETAKPAELVPELRLDLLMASPTCTYHSRARGGRPTSDQQRMDPWHVVRWCTDLRVSRLLIENVPEFVEWGPIDTRTGRPIKSRKGEYFRAWWKALEGLGARGEWRIVNCADYGDATTRKRFMAMLRFDGKKACWPAATHAPASRAAMLGLKPWRPAREIIDWSNKGKSIFQRKKPLRPKTLARIHAGAVKFKWPEPFLVVLRNHMDGQSINGPLPAITAGGTHIGLAEPILLNLKGQSTASSIDDPAPTLTAPAGHLAAVEPFILSQQTSGAPRNLDEPLPTITTGGAGAANHPGCARHAIIEPFILNRHGDNGSTRAHEVNAPLPTADRRGAGYLIEPVADPSTQIWRCLACGETFIDKHAGTEPGGLAPPECPRCGEEGSLQPFILSQVSGGAPRTTGEPVPTITTGGAGGAHALIAPYYGSGSGETCGSTEQPLPTVTSKARFGMVVPVTNDNGGPGPRDTAEPLPTITTAKGGEFALVMPVTHHGGDRTQSPSEPLPTVTGAHRGELAIAVTDGRRFDILFRMLEPGELAAAMGFSDAEVSYEFVGTKTERTKQIGNAVPVNTAKALVAALVDS